MNDFNLYLEIFGYIGTALVIISMMMTSVVKLRIFNICGSIISMVYAIINNTWPIVVLNFSLVAINLFQLLRTKLDKKTFSCVKTSSSDQTLKYFLNLHLSDLKKFFPDFANSFENQEIFIVLKGCQIAGVISGTKLGDTFEIYLDYTSPEYRDFSVARFLYEYLPESLHVKSLQATSNVPAHLSYLKKMGFCEKDGVMIKNV